MGLEEVTSLLMVFKGDAAPALRAMGQIKGGLAEVQGSSGGFMSSLGGIMTKVAAGIVMAGAGIVALSIDMGAKYQEATTSMQTNSQMTEAQAKAMGDAFLDTAGKTQFSAEEMMSALAPVGGEFHALYGRALETGEGLTLMKNAGNLAVATHTDLKVATKALSDVMVAFHAPMDQAGKITDALYGTSRAAGVSVDDLAAAIDKLHGKLGELGPSLQDSGALVVELKQHGLEGGRAMMAFTSGMNTLTSGAKGTQTELAKLNVHIFDAHGKFVGMQSVIDQLHGPFEKMTEEQRKSAAASLFGKTAAEQYVSIIRDGVPAFQKAGAEAGKLGEAQKASDARSKDFTERLKVMKASLADLGVKIGTDLMPVAKGLTDWFIAALPTLEKFGPIILGVAGAIVGVKLAMIAAKIAGEAWQAAQLLIKGATIAWTVVQWLLNVALDANPIGLIIIGILLLVGIVILVVTHWKQFGEILGKVGGIIVGAFGAAVKWIGTELGKLPGQILGVLGSILGALGKWALVLLTWASVAIPGFVGKVMGFLLELPGKVLGLAVGLLLAFGKWELQILAWVAKAIPGVVKSVMDFIGALPGKIVDFAGTLVQAIGAWEWKLINWATSAIPRFVKSVMDEFGKLPGQVIEIGGKIIEGLIKGLLGGIGKIAGAVGQVASSVVGGLKGVLGIHSPAEVPAAQIGEPIMEGVAAGMTRNDSVAKAIKDKVGSLQGGALALGFSAVGSMKAGAMGGASAGAGEGRGGVVYNVTNNITNPEPEPASTSIAREMRKLSYLAQAT